MCIVGFEEVYETVETGETGETGEKGNVEEGEGSESQSTPLLAQKTSSVGSEGSTGKKGMKSSEKTTTTTTKGKGKTGSIMSFFAKKWIVCWEDTRRWRDRRGVTEMDECVNMEWVFGVGVLCMTACLYHPFSTPSLIFSLYRLLCLHSF